MNDLKDARDKYVAKALEGYEQNYKGVSQHIDQMETQLEAFKEQQAEMLEGITEMKDLLGLDAEEEFPPLSTVEGIDEE
jgi:F0F1-type ATP synthase membrane subunit b/b'